MIGKPSAPLMYVIDWESITAAVGSSVRPAPTRSCPRSPSTTRCGNPRAAHRSKNAYTACHGGKSAGSARHSTPYRTR